MKNISVLLLFLFFVSCVSAKKGLVYEGTRNITQKEFKTMIDDDEVDHVEAGKKDVYVFLKDEAAQKRGVSQAPQFHFSIKNHESFLNEMESLDRAYLVHPVKQ